MCNKKQKKSKVEVLTFFFVTKKYICFTDFF